MFYYPKSITFKSLLTSQEVYTNVAGFALHLIREKHHVISENLIAVALAIRIEQLAFIITSALCTCARAVLFTLIFGLTNAINIR